MEDPFQNKKREISSHKAKMCGRFETPTEIMAKNFIPQLRYPMDTRKQLVTTQSLINRSAHEKRTIGLLLKLTALSDMNAYQ